MATPDDPLPEAAPEREVPFWASVEQIEALVRERVPGAVCDSIAGGSGDELTLTANVRGFDRFYLRPRVLVDVSAISTETELLGMRLGAPMLVAPMGGVAKLWPRAECALAAGAADAGIGFILSTESSLSLEEVARSAGDARWFQLYFISRDRGVIAEIVLRAEAAGYLAICVTVDAPTGAFRRRDLVHQAAGAPPPVSREEGNASVYMPSYAVLNDVPVARFPLKVSDPALTWKHIEWLRSVTRLPILVKGIMTAEDARCAVEIGAAGVYVSDHGGRHLDHTLGTIEVLPEVVEAVRGRVPIVIDGGFRRPTDVALALALGASAVALGRPAAWAVGYGGRLGVSSFFRYLVVGLARTMAELGITSLAGFTRAHVGMRGAAPHHPTKL